MQQPDMRYHEVREDEPQPSMWEILRLRSSGPPLWKTFYASAEELNPRLMHYMQQGENICFEIKAHDSLPSVVEEVAVAAR
jgi:hypothetical protein